MAYRILRKSYFDRFIISCYFRTMEIIIIIALILLNGIFSLSEMALVSSRKFKLETAKKKGSTSARKALELSENPTKFLSTVQIGITLIGILLGVYSGENLTNDILKLLEPFPAIQPYAKSLSTVIIVVLVTYLSIVLGELLPKRLGMAFPETLIMVFARPMYILSKITSPFVWVLTASNNLIISILGLEKMSDNKITEEEIKSIVKESAEFGEIDVIEHDIVERVFELGDRKVNSLLTHRKDIVFFKTSESLEEIHHKINTEQHSAYPVSTSNNLDDVIGIVLLKDLFIPSQGKDFDIRQYVKKPIYLNENTLAYKVLELFKKHKMHYGIVVDEYGATLGIVTMDDVVDALVGDVTEDHHDEYSIVQREDGSWFVDGQYSVLEFAKYFQLDTDYFNRQAFTTVAGLIIHLSNKLPDVGEKVEIEDLELEVVDKDKQRIDKILVTRKV